MVGQFAMKARRTLHLRFPQYKAAAPVLPFFSIKAAKHLDAYKAPLLRHLF